MRIYHNISAVNAWRTLTTTQTSLSKTLEKLSTGLRINRAADDAAGLAISEKMRNQIKGLNKAIENAQHAISMLQTGEGALNEIHSILKRMRELAVQSTSDTNTDVDREQLQAEFNRLREEIDRIAKTTQYNAMNLLDGKYAPVRNQADVVTVSRGSGWFDASISNATNVQDGIIVIKVGQLSNSADSQLDVKAVLITASGMASTLTTVSAGSITIYGVNITWDTVKIADINDYGGSLASGVIVDGASFATYGINTSTNQFVFHIGANAGQIATVGFQDMSADALGIGYETLVRIDTQEAAEFTISAIDAAIYKVSNVRSEIGALQNRLEHTINNLGVAMENLTAAESRIRDADMAKEMMEFTRQQILLQSGSAMLSQANVLPQNVLQLFR